MGWGRHSEKWGAERGFLNGVLKGVLPDTKMHDKFVRAPYELKKCSQARFYVGVGGIAPKPEPCPPNIWLQQQYAVVKHVSK